MNMLNCSLYIYDNDPTNNWTFFNDSEDFNRVFKDYLAENEDDAIEWLIQHDYAEIVEVFHGNYYEPPEYSEVDVDDYTTELEEWFIEEVLNDDSWVGYNAVANIAK